MIVTGDKVARFVSDALNIAICPPFTCMGLEQDGLIVAGVIFSQYEHPDIHLTVAGHRWTRRFLQEVGCYVFEQLGCLRMTFTTESDDVSKLAERLGGQIEGRMRSHFGEGRDGIIIGVLKSEYKWVSMARK